MSVNKVILKISPLSTKMLTECRLKISPDHSQMTVNQDVDRVPTKYWSSAHGGSIESINQHSTVAALPPLSLICNFGKQNTRGNVYKISISLTCYRHIGSKSTNHSPLAWHRKVTRSHKWLWLVDFNPICRQHVRLAEILETFPRVFCFPKSRINENGGKCTCSTFFTRRPILSVVKLGRQNHCHSFSVFSVPRGPFLERPGNFSGQKAIFSSSVSKNLFILRISD